MKAVAIERFGGPEVLGVRDLPAPSLRPGHVRVRVHRAGVNYADIVLRNTGHPLPPSLPVVPGFEGAGVVLEVGEGVRGVHIGDRVAFLTFELGGYAEQVVVDAARVFTLPADVTFDTAAALTMQGLTAHYLVFDKHPIGPGKVVLVHAAAGGMGLLLTRWSKRLGATVLGTVSTDAKADAAKQAGADRVIVYSREDFVAETLRATDGRGADYIIDGVGKSTLAKSLEAVAEHGHVTSYGMASGLPDPIAPVALMTKSVTLSGGNLMTYVRTQSEFQRRAGAVFAGAKEGWLRPRIDRILPLEAASEAHRIIEGRDTIGKVLLACSP